MTCGMKLEFYIYDDELWYITTDGRNCKLTENDTDIIAGLLSSISEMYPAAYASLQEEYSRSATNGKYYQFLMVRRFCKCNLGKLDNTKIDLANGTFNMERVSCPLRGECKHEGVICCPKFNSKLSEAELRVMRLVYDGLSNEEIAERLFLSPHTIKNHIKSVYAKLGIHEKAEFVKYADKNDIFCLTS
ncbi:helix-turn-helix domain-containing protein [Sodaliphilus pleomorphus]|nr:helix-turn-helix transcriptional regulator [Sodaliphilus pleomorphus]